MTHYITHPTLRVQQVKLELITFLLTCRNSKSQLMCFQFVSKYGHEESVQKPRREDKHGAGYGAERQQGSEHVEEQQQQQGPVAGQRAQAQPGPPVPLRRVPGRRALLEFCGSIGGGEVVTTQSTQEIWTWAERIHVLPKLQETKTEAFIPLNCHPSSSYCVSNFYLN